MTGRPRTKRGEIATSPARLLGHEDTAVFETHVVPSYLKLFGERLVSAIVPSEDARVCHVHCRTGYPDAELLDYLSNAHVFGCDASVHAVQLARSKASAIVESDRSIIFDYRMEESYPLSYPAGGFSHAFTIHPLSAPVERVRLMDELARIVAPRGQALIAMPLRGSFIEIADLLRECALKYELSDLASSVEAAAQLRPSDEAFARELERAGFESVEVTSESIKLEFAGGRGFFDDPVARLLLLPEFRVNLALGRSPMTFDPFDYVREAIDKYWRDDRFRLTVNVGVVSGRRRAN